MSGKTGFGTGGVMPAPPITEEEAMAAQGDTGTLLKLMEQHLRRLAEKYVEKPVDQPNVFTIQASAAVFTKRLDYTTQPHNSLIICVNAGTLNLFSGDYSGVGQSTTPNYGIFTAGTPIQLFLPLSGRVWTIINPSSAVDLVASVIPVAL